jgi:transposase-like protein
MPRRTSSVSRWPADYRVELEAFWRSHLEGWRRSDLNQREYCEAHGLPLKRFGNWRAKFKQEDEAPRKLLYRRSGALSHMTKWARHMTNEPGLPVPGLPPAAAGRRSFSEAEKRRIVDEASQLGVTLSQVARRYGISRRVLFRWKEAFQPEPAPTIPIFAPVQVTDAAPVVEESATAPSVAMIVERSAPGIEVELIGGRRVRFERDADPETVRRLVALLEGSAP